MSQTTAWWCFSYSGECVYFYST